MRAQTSLPAPVLCVTPEPATGKPFDASRSNALRRAGKTEAPLWVEWYGTALRTLETAGRFDERTCRDAAAAYADRMTRTVGTGGPAR